ncbi:sprouty-related, EVH1 domain-containing protein 2-like [Gigantopelta aegis]|uniref:sprouty-related, EVH1 domain-containing protein 2-like n=1 Tax=Gigantopelta aegis TaxID=1735272 RepID=UPI001B889C14|nr:sprouty-related, EVH1 domain-containing protein 2-like [Gigantopelta aegis]
MTEETLKDGDYLVHVQAQVMTRDDSTGGWVPMGGGGLSNVGLRKLAKLNGGGDLNSEYIIYGQRIADRTIVLDCSLKKDIEYTKANPKFHHWKTDEKRFGLTFERSDDAKAFDKGVSKAVADLKQGLVGVSSSLEGDEGVFQMVELPLMCKDNSSQSASTTSTTTSSPSPNSPVNSVPGLPDAFQFSHPHANHHHLHRIHYISAPQRHHHKPASSPPSEKSSSPKSDSFESSSGQDDVSIRPDEPTSLSGKSDTALLDSDSVEPYKEDSYVTFSKSKPGAPHEYSYPNLEPVAQKPPTKREVSTKRQQAVAIQNPPLPLKPNKGRKGRHKTDHQSGRLLNQRSRCKHCNEVFSRADNQRGSCEDAPDDVQKLIECVTCVWCSKCLIYHCMSDADGEYRHPCVCDASDDSNCKKWTALTILSFFIPCLWCYWPLTACHRCGVSCGCCGGRHVSV